MLGIQVIERVFIKNALTVIEFDDVFGGFALSETVDGISASRLHICFLIRLLPFFFAECDLNGHGAFFGSLCFVFHNLSPDKKILFYSIQHFSTIFPV